MTDRPIIFSAPMILALLREAKEIGTGKSMTRRLAWGHWLTVEQAARKVARGYKVRERGDAERAPAYAQAPSPWQRVKPGDRLWVRENWRHWRGSASQKTACYAADGQWIDCGSGWRGRPKGLTWCSPLTPSIHMPRWASRLTLIVTHTKIERLQSISEVECEMEGCRWSPVTKHWSVFGVDGLRMVEADTAQGCFSGLWTLINGADSWNQNPEVVALRFNVIAANIDAPEAKAA